MLTQSHYIPKQHLDLFDKEIKVQDARQRSMSPTPTVSKRDDIEFFELQITKKKPSLKKYLNSSVSNDSLKVIEEVKEKQKFRLKPNSDGITAMF